MKKALENVIEPLGGAVRPLCELPPVTYLPGGIPRGRVVEIFGDHATGKTTLALQIAHSVDNALYIDADHGLAPEQCRGLYLGKPDTLEDAFTMVEIAAPAMDVIVVDTLDALPTRSELQCPLGFDPGGAHIKLVSRAIPRLLGTLARSGCTLVMVCQTRETHGVAPQVYSTGGRALRNFASLRLEAHRQIDAYSVTVAKSKSPFVLAA